MNNTTQDKSWSEIKNEVYKVHNTGRLKYRFLPALLISANISPIISAFSIKHGIFPNKLTLFMVPISIIGSILISIHSLFFKIIGAVVIHLWFAIDIADGEVARCTSNFSKFGYIMDFLAHHIGHVFYITAFILNMYQLGRYRLQKILLIYAVMLYAEYSFRNLCSIEALFNISDRKSGYQNSSKGKILLLIKILSNQFDCIDNYVLISSISILFDFIFELNITFCISILFCVISIIKNSIRSIQYLKYAYQH